MVRGKLAVPYQYPLLLGHGIIKIRGQSVLNLLPGILIHFSFFRKSRIHPKQNPNGAKERKPFFHRAPSKISLRPTAL